MTLRRSAECASGWWFHLRRCAHCGHIGCAILRHPSTPATTRHPIVQSFEPGEDWFWDYRTEEYADGPVMAPPQYHPLDQPVPGAAGRVPRDWQDHLH